MVFNDAHGFDLLDRRCLTFLNLFLAYEFDAARDPPGDSEWVADPAFAISIGLLNDGTHLDRSGSNGGFGDLVGVSHVEIDADWRQTLSDGCNLFVTAEHDHGGS